MRLPSISVAMYDEMEWGTDAWLGLRFFKKRVVQRVKGNAPFQGPDIPGTGTVR